jgi:hypothetical protein
LIAFVGCSQDAPPTTVQTNSPTAIDLAKYLLDSEPEGAIGVIKTREEAADQDDVVIVGRIGGRDKPFIKDRAAFSIVDPSLKSCAEIGSDNCPKPWDFC